MDLLYFLNFSCSKGQHQWLVWKPGDAKCVAQWSMALSQPAATGRSMGQRTIGLASSGLGRVWLVGISLSHRALATLVAGQAQCTLTRSLGVRCFLRHIGAAGFRVGCALLRSSAAWLGCVSEGAWLSTFVSPEPVREL
jgi:sarcosine oxidase gamma subunit